ncbi:MAG TPA: CCE_0567 family metalloprotein [Roseateles sp.]
MADLETLKAEAKKANAKATQAKMDLHDLSEELPTNWERILDVAKVAHDAHVALMAARKQLADAQAAAA